MGHSLGRNAGLYHLQDWLVRQIICILALPNSLKLPLQGRYELLRPKRTSLKYRIPEADEGCIEFLSCLLSVDPHQRPTAREALEHPWLQCTYSSSAWAAVKCKALVSCLRPASNNMGLRLGFLGRESKIQPIRLHILLTIFTKNASYWFQMHSSVPWFVCRVLQPPCANWFYNQSPCFIRPHLTGLSGQLVSATLMQHDVRLNGMFILLWLSNGTQCNAEASLGYSSAV